MRTDWITCPPLDSFLLLVKDFGFRVGFNFLFFIWVFGNLVLYRRVWLGLIEFWVYLIVPGIGGEDK